MGNHQCTTNQSSKDETDTPHYAVDANGVLLFKGSEVIGFIETDAHQGLINALWITK